MDAGEIRRRLTTRVEQIAALYGEFTALYLGWYQQSALAAHSGVAAHSFERQMSNHLTQNRSKLVVLIDAAIEDASESASALAGDTFRSKTAQSARRDLEVLAADDIERKLVAQLQRDQGALAQKRTRHRLQAMTESETSGLGDELSELLYRPDRLGRRRNAQDYIRVEVNHGLFSLVNTLTYALLLQRGDSVCALDHALEGSDWIRLDDFMKIQQERMHPRSTLLIHAILES